MTMLKQTYTEDDIRFLSKEGVTQDIIRYSWLHHNVLTGKLLSFCTDSNLNCKKLAPLLRQTNWIELFSPDLLCVFTVNPFSNTSTNLSKYFTAPVVILSAIFQSAAELFSNYLTVSPFVWTIFYLHLSNTKSSYVTSNLHSLRISK